MFIEWAAGLPRSRCPAIAPRGALSARGGADALAAGDAAGYSLSLRADWLARVGALRTGRKLCFSRPKHLLSANRSSRHSPRLGACPRHRAPPARGRGAYGGFLAKRGRASGHRAARFRSWAARRVGGTSSASSVGTAPAADVSCASRVCSRRASARACTLPRMTAPLTSPRWSFASLPRRPARFLRRLLLL